MVRILKSVVLRGVGVLVSFLLGKGGSSLAAFKKLPGMGVSSDSRA